MSSAREESRILHRIKNSKNNGRTYANIDRYINKAKKAISDNGNTKKQFEDLLGYLNNPLISQREFLQFGQKFPYDDFLLFILTNQKECFRLLALQILSRTMMFEKAKYDFFFKPELIEMCNSLIADPKCSSYIFLILISGSIYEEFGKIFLDMGLCDFLIECNPSQELAMLVCNLTLYESDYLNQLLEIIYNIMNANITYSTFSYAIKSLHHILDRWDDIDPSVLEEIDEKFTPLFYESAPQCFKTTDSRLLNSLLRYLGHLNDVPVEFGLLILESITNIEKEEKLKNAKTIKLAAEVFRINVETWLPEYQASFLEVFLIKSQFVPYDIKATIFSTVLLYYHCTDGDIDPFMPVVIEWCLEFIEDQTYTTQALQKLYEIASAAKEDEDIMSSIASSVPFFEELMLSGKADDEALEIAENLIAIFDTQ